MAAPVATVNLDLIERNDHDIELALTKTVDGVTTVLDTTGLTIEVYFKASDTEADGTPLTSGVTTEVEVVSAVAGTSILHYPASLSPDNTKGIWRVDVVDSTGKRHTCIIGTVTRTGI